jgi:cyclohexanone monooxygenase
MPREKYTRAPEILEYCKTLGERCDLYKQALFSTQVKSIVWDEATSLWTVHTSRGDKIKAKFVVAAAGGLNRAKLPGIPGILVCDVVEAIWDAVKRFSGTVGLQGAFISHESLGLLVYWWRFVGQLGQTQGQEGCRDRGQRPVDFRLQLPDSFAFTLSLQTGATAIQCVPHLGQSSGHLYVFSRTPSSVDTRGNKPTDPEWWKSLKPGCWYPFPCSSTSSDRILGLDRAKKAPGELFDPHSRRSPARRSCRRPMDQHRSIHPVTQETVCGKGHEELGIAPTRRLSGKDSV